MTRNKHKKILTRKNDLKKRQIHIQHFLIKVRRIMRHEKKKLAHIHNGEIANHRSTQSTTFNIYTFANAQKFNRNPEGSFITT